VNTRQFIEKKTAEIKKKVGAGTAISALSGGVDSSTCTVLAWRALGKKLKVIFIDDGLMREDEPRQVRDTFGKLGIRVEIVNARR
jgi:GMP synthase (glutamine-hydrolysing)